jgi:polysaccharide export outer membrane protein
MWSPVNPGRFRGFTELADTDRIQISRRVTDSDGAHAETFLISAGSPRFRAERIVNLDTVTVSNRLDLLPLVFFEGAVIPEGGVDAGSTNGRLRYRLKDGDTLYTALKSLKDNISPGADLSRAYMTRADDPTQRQVNLEKLLYGYDPALDIALKEGDRFVIPYGLFEVFVTGEVTRSAWVETGSLARLASVIQPFLTEYSSVRDVEVISSAGESRVYDLFRAERFGERDQNPYLNPGDTVRIKPLSRKVTIKGEVMRPGTYQLLPGDELEELIELYGGGFTKLADRERIRITRYQPERETPVRTIYYHIEPNAIDRTLNDLDVVEVDRTVDYLPVIYFEGAVGKGIGIESTTPESSNRFAYRIASGELLSTIVRNIADNFSTVSDLANAYIVRVGSPAPIPADIETLLYRYDTRKDIVMEPSDVVIVPFRQYFVTVSGAVMAPGRYPYVPDRSWKYYVNLAGGPDPARNIGESLTITDMDENPKPKSSPIQPEDRIYVRTNDPLYYLGKFAGIISTILSVTALVIGLVRE